MDFAFTDEQNMIRDTAESFLAEVSGSEAVRTAMATDLGYDPALWQSVCTDLYWQAIHIPEAYGGMGLGQVELVALLEQMGRFLFCSPYFSTVCLGTNALLIAGSEAQKRQYLPNICDGKTASVAYVGKRQGVGQWDAASVTATAEVQGSGYRLNGEFYYVLDGHSVDILIVAAKHISNGNVKGNGKDGGLSLFVFPADHRAITRKLEPTMDQTRRQATITLKNLDLPQTAIMGQPGYAEALLLKLINVAVIDLSAEQMGGAQQILNKTVDYTKERQQFGRSIASFQAIKHKAADMMARAEVARSAVYYAACVAQESTIMIGDGVDAELAEERSAELSEAASVAKSYCSEAYVKNAADALQMHGGVGFTWAYDVHLYLKRAKASEHYLGNASYHRERIAQLILQEKPAVKEPSKRGLESETKL